MCVRAYVCVPVEIIKAVEAGVDVFESSYSYSAAEQGRAVVFGNRVGKDCYISKWPFEIDLNDTK